MLDATLAARIKEWRGAPRYFLALLEALQFRNANLDLMRRLEAAEWNELLSFGDRAHLTLLLSHLPSDVLPGWVASRVQGNVSDNTKRIERVKSLYAEAAEALRRKNAAHIVLKGFTQYPDYVRSPNLRMQSDIDLYCPPNTILYARDALREIGYEASPQQKHVPVEHLPPMIRTRGWQWRENAFDPEMPPAIELHYCFWNEGSARFLLPELEQFWYRRVTRSVDGLLFPALDPVDHLGFCGLHVLRGLVRGDWIIHQVYELAYFLNSHAHDEGFWRNWRVSHSDSLRSLEAIAFRLAKVWFDCELAGEVKGQVLNLPLAIEQWFHYFCSSLLEAMFIPNRDGVWLHVALLKSPGAKLSAIRGGLLPTRVPPLRLADQPPSLDRKFVHQRSNHRPVRYAAYVASRVGFYSFVFCRGAWGGLRWWLSQRKSGAAFQH